MASLVQKVRFVRLLAVLFLSIVSGCGGGGGSGGGGGNSTTTYTIGGTVSGLTNTNSGLVLQNNGGNNLTIPAAATSFTFSTAIANGGAYSVTVLAQPSQMSCSVTSATGTVSSANVSNIAVKCIPKNELVSRSTDDSVIATYNWSVTPVAISGDGRYVAFRSTIPNLAAGSTNGSPQIFRRDRQTNQTVLVSRSSGAAGAEGNAQSDRMSISADGRYILFESYATNLVAGDTNGNSDIFLRDMQLETTTRVSVGDGGAQANWYSRESSISADGRYAAFYSEADNIVTGVPGLGGGGLYLRDLQTGINTLVSATPAGSFSYGRNPSISADGSRIAFYSNASNLVSNDTNGVWDIFVYDRNAAVKIRRVSIATDGSQRNQGNESASRVVEPTISGNGDFVAFATTSDNLVSGDTNTWQDVFIHQLSTGITTRASVGSSGTEGNADSPVGQGERIALSYTGEWVAFSTKAYNIAGGAASVSNVLLHNTITGKTTAVTNSTTNFSGNKGPAISADGRFVVFDSNSTLDPRFASSGVFVQDQTVP